MKPKSLGTTSLHYPNKQNYSNKLISQSSAFISNPATVGSLHSSKTDHTETNLVLSWGAWVAQLVGRPTSAQVMISQSVSPCPALGSVLTARSLESASDSVSPSLSLCPSPTHALSLCLSLFLSLSLSLKSE